MNIEALKRNRVLLPVQEMQREFCQQLEIVDRDITQAQNQSIDKAWRYIMTYHAFAGLARMVILMNGYRTSGLYGNKLAIDLMVHYSGQDLILPKRDELIKIRKRRNLLIYDHTTGLCDEELNSFLGLVEALYDQVLDRSWQQRLPLVFARFNLVPASFVINH